MLNEISELSDLQIVIDHLRSIKIWPHPEKTEVYKLTQAMHYMLRELIQAQRHSKVWEARVENILEGVREIFEK